MCIRMPGTLESLHLSAAAWLGVWHLEIWKACISAISSFSASFMTRCRWMSFSPSKLDDVTSTLKLAPHPPEVSNTCCTSHGNWVKANKTHKTKVSTGCSWCAHALPSQMLLLASVVFFSWSIVGHADNYYFSFFFLDRSIQKTCYLILVIEALVGIHWAGCGCFNVQLIIDQHAVLMPVLKCNGTERVSVILFIKFNAKILGRFEPANIHVYSAHTFLPRSYIRYFGEFN